ncbi:hypothetical protein K1T71_014283 [Dendrolimus kikuchii]|uniref:Uncharacterized protein n=1 Tax=Dendrolimus kikuchii TaxID=765133 RepID=A0ACC1CFI0_9NEOP|nr:hypothetical protein K1T71_014283 [Dendrolimus kikuchii]
MYNVFSNKNRAKRQIWDLNRECIVVCRTLFVDLRRHGGRLCAVLRGEARSPEIEVRIGNVQRGNVARPSELSVGSKWRLCVIDTVEFALKMPEFVMYLVVGWLESGPGTSGLVLRTRPKLSPRSMYVSQPYCADTLPLLIYLEKGDCFGPPPPPEVGSWHFVARPFRSLYFGRRCRSVLALRARLLACRGGRRRCKQAVSRPRNSVRDVCLRRAPRASLLARPIRPSSVTEIANRTTETQEMAVSQPRPPDRVDAALEKVAPLRYLKEHECARTERTVTRYYIYYIFYNSFLSYNTFEDFKIQHIEDFPVRISR